jgi:acetyl-CoA C-acetyltransferase
MTATRTDPRPDDVLIAGWAHSRFGKLPDETLESLITRIGGQAIADAGLEPGDIDEVVIGTYNAGLVPLAFPSSLALQIDEALLYRPATRVENACSSGAAAVRTGVRAVRSGDADRVLVIGVEKMTQASPEQVGRALLGASYELAGTDSRGGFAEMFSAVADAYADRYGDPAHTMAQIAAKNHANGMRNPYAQLHKPFDVAFCETVSDRNPTVFGRLKRTDCSPVSDGAAALVLTRRDRAPHTGHGAVHLRAIEQANDWLPLDRRDLTLFGGVREAWQRALERTGRTLDDFSLIEVHDCFTIAELVIYESIGLAEPGQGARLLDDGTVDRDGRLPVNVSGGLKAKGHPVGATGVSQHVLCAMQLTGTAGEMQLPTADVAGVVNMGGTAVSNYASVLERA